MNHNLSKEAIDLIRSKSECNIKTLNTIDIIDIKNYKTKNYDNSNSFADGVNSSNLSPISSFGQDQESGVSPPVQTGPADISYLSVSLKAPKTDRRTLNVDFRLSTSAGGKFNKIVFALTDRYREFFSNLPKERHDDWEYQQCWEYYHGLAHKDKWIAKGRRRGKYVAGTHINQKIKFGLACVLEIKQGQYVANIWITGNHFEVVLNPVDNKQYPFRYDSKTLLDVTEYEEDGGWE
jgi:hypothetical protein